jgi:SOS-response transcriptional repressors (RecA-mediated autopeptidases)
MDIGERIKQRREYLEMSQEELALRVGYKSRSSINKIEKDGRGLPQKKIKAIADALSTTPVFLMGWGDSPAGIDEIDVTKIPGYIPMPVENKKIPIIGSVKCGPGGLAFEYIEGYVCVDEAISGEILAFSCKGDSMKDIGISDGDIAIVRKQCTVENGELAVVIINGNEGTLKRVRYHEGVIILEAANQAYPPRIFTGEDVNIIKIVGKVIELRKKF